MTAHRVRDWLIFSDVHILVVAAGWMLGNSALLGYPLPPSFLALSSVGAFLVYRVDRLLVSSPEDALNVPQRAEFGIRYRWPLLAVASLLTLLAALLAITLRVLWLELAFLIGALGLLYPIRFLPGGRRPKDFRWMKTGLIATCWVGGGAVLPYLLFSEGKDNTYLLGLVILLSVYRIAYILPNLISADWLDRKGDKVANAGNLVRTWSRRTTLAAVLGSATVGTLMAFMLVGFVEAVSLLVFDLVGLWVLALASSGIIGGNQASGARQTAAHPAKMIYLDLLVAWPMVVWLYSVLSA